MKIGVCYYPEHWPESRWTTDALHMKEIGISMVRIGEFAWSRLEPEVGNYQFDWLERAIDTLHKAGHEVILGTPTATPPAWLIRNNPDMLAVDEHGRVRDFGSRRHYCFSSQPYRVECERIVTALAERFGSHPAISAWQTDNEYGCHSTSISYSPAALSAFQQWCSKQYRDIEALNLAWGNVFWSMEYSSFTQIGLPVGTVTESNPAHRLAFWRFSTEQIKTFNSLQVDILRKLSPGRDIVHNFMGNFMEFDHFDVADDLDVATWDNYPLGFLTRDGTDEADQKTYFRTGHPDSSSFHHDLYRACGRGRMWLMEQQPGPVNWAPYNPAPVPGMVRLWGWEAFAHGAEVVSYFRWRQASFAQEQMHAGLCLPDGREDDAAREVKLLAEEIQQLSNLENTMQKAPVAMVFDYAGDQAARIQQPDGQHYDPLVFTQCVYSAIRQLGVQVDFVSSRADLDGYKLIVLANCTVSDSALCDKLANTEAQVVMFPRTGSKTTECSIPDQLAPGAYQCLLNLKVTRVESLPRSIQMMTDKKASIIDWRERVEADYNAQDSFDDGWGFHYRKNQYHYINACPDRPTLISILAARLLEAKIAHIDLGPGLRIAQRGSLVMAFNYGPNAVELSDEILAHFGFNPNSGFRLGQQSLQISDIGAWSTT
ncbi:UNVERIFIED_CONTAM: hypothetical protein GTU68_055739 [Idotea baltica]|nr:hypothetical protein [Idotea baltica]